MENESKKNKSVLSIIVVILSIIVIALVIFIILNMKNFNLFDSKYNESNKSNESVQSQIKNKLDLGSDKVVSALEIFDNLYLSDEEVYKLDSYEISNISNYDLISTAIKNLDREYIVSICEENVKRKNVSMDLLNESLEKLGIDKKITIDDIKKLEPLNAFDTGIKIENDTIKLYGTCGGVFEPEDFVLTKKIEAFEEGNYLYLYEKHAFGRYHEDFDFENPLIDYYKEFNKNTLVDKNLSSSFIVDSDGNLLENSELNWDLYNTYEYKFEKKNNNYYFVKIQLVK